MRAHGIRSYHRPGRREEALALAAPGAVPGLLDLETLNLSTIGSEDRDLHLGAAASPLGAWEDGQLSAARKASP